MVTAFAPGAPADQAGLTILNVIGRAVACEVLHRGQLRSFTLRPDERNAGK